jgi:hypothetical protein
MIEEGFVTAFFEGRFQGFEANSDGFHLRLKSLLEERAVYLASSKGIREKQIYHHTDLNGRAGSDRRTSSDSNGIHQFMTNSRDATIHQ